MNNCSEYTELISAYADGELTDSDRQRVEIHLSTCESCSALLEVFREISSSVNEIGIPTPDTLRTGIMEQVLLEGTAPIPDNAKKPTKARGMIFRFAPIAACLALVLLTLPWIIDYLGNSTSSDERNEAPMVAKDAAMEAPNSGLMAIDGELLEGDGDIARSGEFGASGHSAFDPQLPHPAADLSIDPDEDADSGAYRYDATLPDTPQDSPNDIFTQQPEGASSSQPIENNTNASTGTGVAPEDVQNTLVDIDAAYAWITIVGELPDLLMKYRPEQLGSWLNYEMMYRIPRAAAQDFIKEISGQAGVTIVHNNENSEYAIVMYSSVE